MKRTTNPYYAAPPYAVKKLGWEEGYAACKSDFISAVSERATTPDVKKLLDELCHG